MKRSVIGKLIGAAEQFVEVADLGPSTEAYDDSLRKLKAAIKAASETPEDWQPIETAPKDGTNILLYAPAAVYQGKAVTERLTYGHWEEPEHGKYLGDCGGECRCPEYDEAPPPYWYSDDGGFTEEYPPTHWMPLPKPPAKSAT